MNFDFIKKKNLKNSGFAFSAMLIIYVLLSFVGQALISAIVIDEVLRYFLTSLFSIISIMIAIIFFAPKSEGRGFKSLNLTKFNPIYLIPAVTLSAGMFLGLGFVNDSIVTALQNANLKVPMVNIPLENAWHLTIFTIALAVLPAIAEELFFRGVILSGFEKTGKIFSAVCVSILFAFYHCSLAQFVYQLIYGFFLTLLTIKSKSVIPSIIAHFFNNFAVLIFTFFNVVVPLYSIYIIVIGLILIVISALFIFLYNKQSLTEKVKDKPDVLGFLLFSIFGVVICISIMILGLII